MMGLSDGAGLLGRSWDTVKDLVQERLEADPGRPPLQGLRYLSLAESLSDKSELLDGCPNATGRCAGTGRKWLAE